MLNKRSTYLIRFFGREGKQEKQTNKNCQKTFANIRPHSKKNPLK